MMSPFLALYGLRSVHLQLYADASSPLSRRYDAKEVLGARVSIWPKHLLQLSEESEQ
jgi:hypothetical protein